MSFLKMNYNEECVYFPKGMDAVDIEMKAKYESALPFSHIVIEGFLPEKILHKVNQCYPDEEDNAESYNRSVERFKTSYNPDSIDSGFLRSLFYSFNSKPFLSFLQQLTGISGLIPDPYYLGGGLHQTNKGGHLGIHADFNLHRKLRLLRRVNVLIYLNENWQEEYGGYLELWEKDMSAKAASIAPIFNRCVIFNTDDESFHGHPDALCTPEDVSRRSIALYYYTASDAVFNEFSERTTLFKERAGSGDKLGFKVRALYLLNDLLPPIVMRFLLKLVRNKKSSAND